MGRKETHLWAAVFSIQSVVVPFAVLSRSDHSFQEILTFSSLAATDVGMVSCLGKRIKILVKREIQARKASLPFLIIHSLLGISKPVPVEGRFNMEDPPIVEKQGGTNNRVVLDCSVSGVPAPDIQWKKVREE